MFCICDLFGVFGHLILHIQYDLVLALLLVQMFLILFLAYLILRKLMYLILASL